MTDTPPNPAPVMMAAAFAIPLLACILSALTTVAIYRHLTTDASR